MMRGKNAAVLFLLFSIAISAVAQEAVQTPNKATIAVLPFSIPGSVYLVDEDLVKQLDTNVLTDKFVQALVKTRKFDVVERSRLDALMDEKELVETDLVDPERCIELGKLLTAEYLMTGSISGIEAKVEYTELTQVERYLRETSGNIIVDMRIVETETGKVVAAEQGDVGLTQKETVTVPGDSEVSPGFLDALQRKVVDELTLRVIDVVFPLKVAKVSGEKAYLNSGQARRVKVGDVFCIYSQGEVITDPDTGEIIGCDEEEIGRLKVADVHPTMSIATILYGEDRIQEGAVCRKPKERKAIEMPGNLQGRTVTRFGESPEGGGSGAEPRPQAGNTIAVLPFDTAPSVDGELLRDVGPLIDVFNQELVESGMFNVVDRENLAQVMSELDLVASDLVDPDRALQFGKLLGARYLLRGTIAAVEASVGYKKMPYVDKYSRITSGLLIVNMDIIETETGVIKAAKKGKAKLEYVESGLEQQGDYRVSAEFIDRLRTQVVEDLVSQVIDAIGTAEVRVPPGSDGTIKVSEVRNGKAYLNCGQGTGVEEGQVLWVYLRSGEVRDPNTGEVLGFVEDLLGRVKIIEVLEKMSVAEILEGTDRIEIGAVCRKVETDSGQGADSGDSGSGPRW